MPEDLLLDCITTGAGQAVAEPTEHADVGGRAPVEGDPESVLGSLARRDLSGCHHAEVAEGLLGGTVDGVAYEAPRERSDDARERFCCVDRRPQGVRRTGFAVNRIDPAHDRS